MVNVEADGKVWTVWDHSGVGVGNRARPTDALPPAEGSMLVFEADDGEAFSVEAEPGALRRMTIADLRASIINRRQR